MFLAKSLKSLRSIYIRNAKHPVEISSIIFRSASDDKKKPPEKPAEKAAAPEKKAGGPEKKAAGPEKKADDKGKTAPAAPKAPVTAPLSDLEKMRKLQAQFQEDNGLPVFLKGGPKDQIMYRGTFGLCILGLVLSLKLFVQMIFFY